MEQPRQQQQQRAPKQKRSEQAEGEGKGATSEGDSRKGKGGGKGKGCWLFSQGKCTYGAECKFSHAAADNQGDAEKKKTLTSAEHNAVIRYAEHHKKDPSEVTWSVVEADGGTAKWSGAAPAPKPKMIFAVLKKREQASREQRRANEFAIVQQRACSSGRMSYREAVELMHGQHDCRIVTKT